MAEYKVPQDVEADDKFLGPLSFKQFIFFGLTAICGYLTFLMISKNLLVLAPAFGLPMIAFGFLAFPWSKEQPTELWLASRIRFMIKPHRRIWDQSGVKQLVQITAPIRVAHAYTDGLSQDEVASRLSALATMVDSRGWAIKNVSLQQGASDDRLVAGNIQVVSPVVSLDAPEDVMDESGGTLAKQFETGLQQATQKHKEEARHLMIDGTREREAQDQADSKKREEDFWFMHQRQRPSDPSLSTFQASSVVHPGDPQTSTAVSDDATVDAAQFLDKVHEKQHRDWLQTQSSHHHVVNPLGRGEKVIEPLDPLASRAEPASTAPADTTILPPPVAKEKIDPDILELANNNDLSVETIQRQGHKKDHLPPDEVVVRLH